VPVVSRQATVAAARPGPSVRLRDLETQYATNEESSTSPR